MYRPQKYIIEKINCIMIKKIYIMKNHHRKTIFISLKSVIEIYHGKVSLKKSWNLQLQISYQSAKTFIPRRNVQQQFYQEISKIQTKPHSTNRKSFSSTLSSKIQLNFPEKNHVSWYLTKNTPKTFRLHSPNWTSWTHSSKITFS